MGLDQDFYRLKKDKIEYELKPRQILGYEQAFDVDERGFVDFNKPIREHIVHFRKQYLLSYAIEKVCGTSGQNDYVVISKEDLTEIANVVWEEFLKLNNSKRKSDQEESIRLFYIEKNLDTIKNLFDFDNYYLLYDECG